MNVLHVNTRAMAGGAGRAAYWLHMRLMAAGHSSRIVSRDVVEGREDLQTWVSPSALWRRMRATSQWLEIHSGLEGLLDVTSWVGYRRHAAWADVINLHGLNWHYFSMFLLPRLQRAAPLVWTLHDMWPLTGHCGYAIDCDRWQDRCQRCGEFSAPAMKADTADFLYKVRERIYARINPVLAAPSRWLLGNARAASLTRGFRSVHIPLGLNLKVFRPIDKAAARLVFDLGSEEKVLLFVAASLSVRRKGADLLVKALGHLRASGSGAVRLMIVGAGGEAMQRLAAYPVLDLGEIRDDLLMVAAYSAADVFVLPTRADNLPLVLLESLACGTPCVSFRVGGVPDAVRPGQTGWLAEPDDARDLARCLHEALASDEKRREMSAACRRVAEEEYDVRLMAERYVRLYEELIEEHRRT